MQVRELVTMLVLFLALSRELSAWISRLGGSVFARRRRGVESDDGGEVSGDIDPGGGCG
jgi:hypothetical protein